MTTVSLILTTMGFPNASQQRKGRERKRDRERIYVNIQKRKERERERARDDKFAGTKTQVKGERASEETTESISSIVFSRRSDRNGRQADWHQA